VPDWMMILMRVKTSVRGAGLGLIETS